MKKSRIRLLAMLLVLMLIMSSTVASAQTSKKLTIGHLSYHTGPFGHVGPQFDAAADFPLSLINEAPPLDAEEVAIIHQDIGTIGEGQAARKLIESDGVEILLNVAGEYSSYRDWLRDYIEDNGAPLLPSVHAGSVDAEIGGVAEEPIFRGAPMDSDQGVATAIRAFDEGAKSVVVLAVENDGMQMQQDYAAAAARALGMEVLDEIDFEPEQVNYRGVITKAQAANPDALLVFCAGEDGGTIVKNAAELGMSTIILGATDWLFPEFPATATMDAINQHKLVEAVGFTYVEGPAWDYYIEKYEESEWADKFEPTNSYNLQYYDLLNVTMLAIEKAGSLNIEDWVAAMHEVSAEPGVKVYSYEEGLEALKNGEDIDYDGVTGEFEYTDTGVVGGVFGVYRWTSLEDMELVDNISGSDIVELGEKMAEEDAE